MDGLALVDINLNPGSLEKNVKTCFFLRLELQAEQRIKVKVQVVIKQDFISCLIEIFHYN